MLLSFAMTSFDRAQDEWADGIRRRQGVKRLERVLGSADMLSRNRKITLRACARW